MDLWKIPGLARRHLTLKTLVAIENESRDRSA
jgi:hypothetical protein